MTDQGNAYLLEDDSGRILLEDGTGILLLETGPDQSVSLNNYEFVTAGDGISVTEKIR